jgi:hypothetical protein
VRSFSADEEGFKDWPYITSYGQGLDKVLILMDEKISALADG